MAFRVGDVVRLPSGGPKMTVYVMLPNGKTMGDEMAPQIAESYKSKKMPKLLPEGV